MNDGNAGSSIRGLSAVLEGAMAFWRVVSATLAVVVVGLFLLPRPTHYEWTAPLWAKAANAIFMALSVAVIWAIVFRRQVELLRVNILSLFALVAMEAVLFWAIQRFGTY
jgi:hypothetical protein